MECFMLLGCGSVVFCFLCVGMPVRSPVLWVLLFIFSSFIFALKVFWNFLNASDCIFVSVEIEYCFLL